MAHTEGTRKLIPRLRAQGFTIESRGTRIRVTSPAGQTVIMPRPNSKVSARAVLNARAALRRIGADL